MKKKVLLILVILIGGVFLFLLFKQNKKEEQTETIPTYSSDVYCKKSFTGEVEGETFTSELRIYITLNEEVVEKAIYQTISQNDATFYGEQYRELYNSLKGVSAVNTIIGGKSVTTITYDYTKMNAKEIKDTLGDLLEETSLLARTKKYPPLYEEYQVLELEGFDCHEN